LRDRAAFWKGREGLREAVFGDEEESGSNVASLSVARSLKQSLKNVRSEGR
jgi:hypothetical protein